MESEYTFLRIIDVAICIVDVKSWSNDQYAGYAESTGQVILPVAFLTDVDLLAGWLLHLPGPYVLDAERGRQILVVGHSKPLGHRLTVEDQIFAGRLSAAETA